MPGAEPGAEVVAQAVVLNKTRCLGGENRDKLSRRIVCSLVLIEFACCDAGCPARMYAALVSSMGRSRRYRKLTPSRKA